MRAIHTLNYILKEMNREWLPVIKTWKLNERHYGALQGLNKAETAEKYGEDQVKIWRRSFDIAPPSLEKTDKRCPCLQEQYRGIPENELPLTESLKTTIERTVPYFEKLHAAGVKVIPVVPSVKLAKRVEEKGADAIVVEGMEAGGHIGVLSTMPLMEQVIPEVSLPVIMAGGFGDGRGLAAALLMGAAGVQMGTRFLVAEECVVHPNVKAKLIEAVDTDTIVTGITIGGAVRGVKNKFSEEFVALEYSGKATKEELLDRATGTNKLAAVDGDVVNGMVQAGETLTLLRSIEPTRVIIERIVREARETLAHAKSIEI